MSAPATLEFDASGPFDFPGTAYSHGWVVLSPNAWDAELEVVERIHRLSSGPAVRLRIAAGTDSDLLVTVHTPGSLSRAGREEIAAAVGRMFRLEEDLSLFYALCAERGGPWTPVTEGLGRLLRSPTVFEDVVKTILTTNVQWGGTKRMTRELVEAFGEPWEGVADADRADEAAARGTDGESPGLPPRAFPTPEAIAEVPAERFAERVGLGYRAPYVHELARRVSSGELELEALGDSGLPTPELERELRSIKGVGPYAAATLLMLLGRYDELAVDSVFREFVSRKYFDGERVPDAELRAVYDPWGRWKYLAYWFDLWRGLEEEL